jgi:chromosome segregation ATPase
MPPRKAHAELERLREARAEAGVALRQAEEDMRDLRYRAQQLEQEIKLAYAHGEDAKELAEQLLRLTQTELPRAEWQRDGRRQRVEETELARRRFVSQNLGELKAELEPDAQAAIERMEKARRELLDADKAWTEARLAYNALLRDAPDELVMAQGQPEPRHGLEAIVSELRRAEPVGSPDGRAVEAAA